MRDATKIIRSTLTRTTAGEPLHSASGMAACAAVFGAVLRPGDVVVLPSNAYYTARILLQEYFAKMGVVLRMAPTAGNAQGELLEGARLLWLESPSNPGMDICDISMLSD